MNILDHNRAAWNNEVRRGNQWTIPVTKEEIDAAAAGEARIFLTPLKIVPKSWLGDLKGKRVLCLASGGGQQGPILAAAGAEVTVFDNSDQQLRRDEETASAFGLKIRTVQGNMQDLSAFQAASFDMIVHPVSNVFVDDVLPVWKGCGEVIQPGGILLSGFTNPLIYMMDWEGAEKSGDCRLKYAIPYADTESLSAQELLRYQEEKIPLEFGHSLTDLIQGQIDAGFHITGFYEDKGEPLLDQYTEVFIATRAEKLGGKSDFQMVG